MTIFKNHNKMKNYITYLFLIITLLACSSKPANHEKTNPNSSLIWEVSGNGLEKPSYLFGTIHLIQKQDFFLPEGTEEAFENADVIVLEINPDISIKDQLSASQKMILPAGTSLATYMDEDDYQAFKSLCIDTLGLSEKKFERYSKIKPFFLMGILLKEHYGKIESYEQYFYKQTDKMSKEFYALESFEFQMAIVDSFSIEEQFEELEAENFLPEFEKLMNYYKSQDLDKILLLLEESEWDSETELAMLINRNKDWAEKLDELMQQKSHFVAVGTAHLPGENGLIKLLEDKGYSVRPL